MKPRAKPRSTTQLLDSLEPAAFERMADGLIELVSTREVRLAMRGALKTGRTRKHMARWARRKRDLIANATRAAAPRACESCGRG